MDLDSPFGHELELRRAGLDDESGRLVEPVAGSVETGIAGSALAGEQHPPIQLVRDSVGLSMQTEEQQIGRRFSEMEEAEEMESQPRLFLLRDFGDESGFTVRPLFPDRGDDFHGASESGRAVPAEDMGPELDDAAEEYGIPTLVRSDRWEDRATEDQQPLLEVAGSISDASERGQHERPVENRGVLARVGVDGQ